STGEAVISFVATGKHDSPLQLDKLPQLPYVSNVRGTFPVSDIHWNLDMSNLTEPARVTIGDNRTDTFIEGFDAFEKRGAVNYGNYGVTYHLKAERPTKAVIVLLARGGVFKGPFKINGQLHMAPKSGVITAFDG